MNVNDLISLVSGNLQEVMQQQGIQQENQQQVQNTVQETVQTELKNQVASGNSQGLMEIFNGNTQNQEGLISSIMSSLTGNLQQQGINNEASQNIASSILPQIFQKFASPETGTASNPLELITKLGFSQDSSLMSTFSSFLGNQNENQDKNNNNEGIGGIINKLF